MAKNFSRQHGLQSQCVGLDSWVKALEFVQSTDNAKAQSCVALEKIFHQHLGGGRRANLHHDGRDFPPRFDCYRSVTEMVAQSSDDGIAELA